MIDIVIGIIVLIVVGKIFGGPALCIFVAGLCIGSLYEKSGRNTRIFK